MFYFPFHIWDVILPIDELHHFFRGVGIPPTSVHMRLSWNGGSPRPWDSILSHALMTWMIWGYPHDLGSLHMRYPGVNVYIDVVYTWFSVRMIGRRLGRFRAPMGEAFGMGIWHWCIHISILIRDRSWNWHFCPTGWYLSLFFPAQVTQVINDLCFFKKTPPQIFCCGKNGRHEFEFRDAPFPKYLDHWRSYSYGHLLVITGYKWDYTFYKWGYKYL